MLASVMIHTDAKRRLRRSSSLTGRTSARIAEGMGSIPMKVIFFFVLSHNISDTACLFRSLYISLSFLIYSFHSIYIRTNRFQDEEMPISE